MREAAHLCILLSSLAESNEHFNRFLGLLNAASPCDTLKERTNKIQQRNEV